MATIVTRAGKGEPLTHVEVDANFTNLNTDKLESGSTAASLTVTSADINGGTIDGTVIGGATPAAISGTTGQFGTSLNVDGTITSDGLTVDGAAKISSSSPYVWLFETDTTDLNGFIRVNAGSTEIASLNDAGSQSIKRINVSNATGDISFYEDTGTTPRFFWDASAEALGVGTTSPDALLHVSGGLTDYSPSASGTGLFHVSGGASSVYTFYVGVTDDGVSLGHNGSGSRYLRFDTNETERMRVTSAGDVLFGTTANLGAGGLTIQPNSSGVSGAASATVIWNRNNTTVNSTALQFRNNNTVVGSITYNNTSTAFNTSSDYRLKEDVQPMVGASDRLMALKPCNFAWKADGTRVDGFLAHEAQEVVPQAVTGKKDGEDMQAIDHSKLVPLLTAALQEALAEIATLNADVAALKGQ